MEKDLSNVKVAVLLAAYNGVEHIAEQIASIVSQTHLNTHLYISDDGSTDNTVDVVKEYQSRYPGRITLFKSNSQGCVGNFLGLACHPKIRADYYAFSDQDDIWMPKKIELGLEMLSRLDADKPQLYGGRSMLVDNECRFIGYSTLFEKKPSFQNALVQCIAGGNTMILNEKSMELLRGAGIVDVICHDWWSYQLVTAVGGQVVYDPNAHLLYRQHGGNRTGENQSIKAQLMRVYMLFAGRFSGWNEQNLQHLEDNKEQITLENLSVLEYFSNSRKLALPLRLYNYFKSGVYRQTLSGNIALILAAMFKRL